MNSAAHIAQFGTPQEKEELARVLAEQEEARRKFYADYYEDAYTVEDLARQKKKADENWANVVPIPSDYYVENQVEIPPEGEDQSDGFRMFTTEDGEEWAFNESQLRGEDPLPLEVQNMVLRGHDGTDLNTSDGTFHFEGPPPDAEAPPEMSIEEFRKRQKANQGQPIDPNDPSWSAPAPPEVTPQDLPEWEHPPLAATDWATGTPAPSRMIRDNPDIKRFHPDYGGIPGKGVPKKQWYGTGNHPLKR